MHPEGTVSHAAELRRKGRTYIEIARATGVSARSVKRWFPDPLPPDLEVLAERRRRVGAGAKRHPRPEAIPGVLWVR